MGEVGRWDPELFARLRRSCGEVRRRLVDQMIQLNTPLIHDLVHQLRGGAPAAALQKRLRNSMRVVGAEDLDWEVALNAGRRAFMKAMEDGAYDPNKGKISFYLKWKIFYELQCEVAVAGVITTKRGEKTASLEYVEDDGHLDRLVGGEPTQDEDDEELLVVDVPSLKPLEPVVPELAPRDSRTALEVLFAEHCMFVRHARCAASALRGRYEHLAFERGELAEWKLLERELLERGVRATRVRVEWSETPVRAFAGVGLQSSRTID